MREYIVSIERNGDQIKVGSIIGSGVSDSCFSYDDEYLSSDDPVAISISLPLQKESFSPEQTRIFFDGLLPEGFTRRSVAQWLHLRIWLHCGIVLYLAIFWGTTMVI